jgi:hypothetical protein
MQNPPLPPVQAVECFDSGCQPLAMLESTRLADLEPMSGRLAASKWKVASRTLSFHNRNRPTKWFTCLAVLCFVCVLLSTTIQATHFCGLRGLETQTAVELDRATSASPACLTCLMAPSMSAVILLVAFFAMASSMLFVGALQMRPKPVLSSFQLYIRPPPQALA